MAYDSARQRAVLFQGNNNSGYLTDTWEWDGSNWLQSATTTCPAFRWEHAMAYDATRQRTVVFGGFSLTTGNAFLLLNDTWEWDGGSWVQIGAVTDPSVRYDHRMTYDAARQRMVMFGGQGASSTNNETWEWDGSNWNQRTPVTTPPPLGYHCMAYDAIRQRVVLFGGIGAGCPNVSNDTWEWDGTTWLLMTSPIRPVARIDAAMVYHAQRQRVFMFGGQTICGSNGFLNDTWEWDGTSWTQLTTSTNPPLRQLHAMAYDSARNRVILFGGRDSSGGFLNDTWEWGDGSGGPGAPAVANRFGSGCGNPVLDLSPVVNARPVINTTAQASLTNIPSAIAFVALGWSRTMAGPFPLPFSLAAYGMPGCGMLQSTELAAQPVAFMAPGNATFSLALPNSVVLIGLHVYLQGWAYAPGVNAGNTIVSNGVEWGIGNS